MADLTTPDQLSHIHQAMISQAHDAMHYVDEAGFVRWVNPRFAQMLGRESADEIIGTKARELYVSPAVRDRLAREVADQGSIRNFVARLKKADDATCVVEINASQYLGPGGKPNGIVGMSREITRRVALETQHRQQAEFQELIMNTMQAAIFAVNAEGCITWLNMAAQQLCGLTTDEATGLNLVKDTPANIHALGELLGPVLRTGQMKRHERCTVFRRESKTPVHLYCTVVPLRDRGELSGAIVETIDISDSVQLYNEMQDAELRFRAIFDDSPDLYVVLDSSGTLLDCNQSLCKRLGYERTELIGQPMDVLYESGSLAQVRALHAKWTSGESVEPIGVRMQPVEGESFEVQFRAVEVRDKENRVVLNYAVHRPV